MLLKRPVVGCELIGMIVDIHQKGRDRRSKQIPCLEDTPARTVDGK